MQDKNLNKNQLSDNSIKTDELLSDMGDLNEADTDELLNLSSSGKIEK
jgi:hypothetical protein